MIHDPFSGLTTEGLYRVSGNKTDQDNIQKQFDQGNTCKHMTTLSVRTHAHTHTHLTHRQTDRQTRTHTHTHTCQLSFYIHYDSCHITSRHLPLSFALSLCLFNILLYVLSQCSFKVKALCPLGRSRYRPGGDGRGGQRGGRSPKGLLR